jgi:hypothetical protein
MFTVSHSICACGPAVASSVAVVYDWGERDSTLEGLDSIILHSSIDMGPGGRSMPLPEQPSYFECF